MTIRPLIDPTKLARLRDLWLQGTPVKVIVNELGLKNVDQVQYWRKRLGLPNRWRKEKQSSTVFQFRLSTKTHQLLMAAAHRRETTASRYLIQLIEKDNL